MTDATTSSLIELLESERLPSSLLQTISSVYEPLAKRIASSAAGHTPFVVGICGPQGSGKSTLARILDVLLRACDLSVAALSLDDLYLTRVEREDLATAVHPLLRTRGVPGTHSVELGIRVLDALSRSGRTTLPSFDKASDDRRPESDWSHIATPVDVALLEGWCVGARPQDPTELIEPINELERYEDSDGRWRRFVNNALSTHYQTLFARIDVLIFLKASSFEIVFRWRAEQEQRLRERSRHGDSSGLMNETALRRFIAHYERLTRHTLREMPNHADIVIELADDRAPIRIQDAPLTRLPSRHP
jgi:D-glycerate 3-kinase